MFAVMSAFAGPLLKFAGVESGGFHLYGTSSRGKTTALQLAASVWGNGADPSNSEGSYVRKWNTTGNGLEGIAAAYTDMLLPLDELGTFGGREIAKTVYDLSGGLGKARMTQEVAMRESRSWRVMVLSSGEISLEQKIAEDSGREAKAGQRVRILDIPIPENIMPNPQGLAPDKFVNRLKANSSRFYGTAGPEFVRRLIESCPDANDLRRELRDDLERWCEGVATDGMGEVERRALRRLSLVVVAGMRAARLGVLPFDSDDMDQAGCQVWSLWRGESANLSDGDRAIRALREFVLRHREARFGAVGDDVGGGPLIRDLAGYIDRGKRLFLFTSDGLKEALRDFDWKSSLRELQKAGFLFMNDDRFASKHYVNSLLGRIRLYAVRMSILEKE